ncbi:MAG: alkaline phosphatase [Polaribacter sp.]|jgi:alkaline phosphatase
MKLMKVFLSFFLIVLVSCKTKNTEIIVKNETPKNVILLIADGTGLSQVSAAFYFKDEAPNYERFKHIGLIKTSSSRQDITDSAAGATAFASGVKTYNGAIGVADDSTEVSTIIEIAALNKIKSGVVATSSIVHATPASFYAHAFKRRFYEEIAADLVASEVDFFAGGGINFFNKRKDGKDLLKVLEAKDFNIDTIALGDFNSIKDYKKAGYLLAADGMPKMLEGRGDYLSSATELGIQFLNKNEDNFFLMVEGSQVDWGGHSNDADYLISELIDFDDAVGKALDFAEKDGNTLVIVTADHETGGFTLASTLKNRADGTSYSDYSEITPTFSTGGHSATLIPVFAYGPGAAEFSGIYENTEIFHKIISLSGWK